MHILGEALDVPLPDRLSLCPSFWVLFGFALYRLRHVYLQDTYTLQTLTCTKHTFTLIWIIDKFTYIFIQRLIDKYRLRLVLCTNEPWRYLSLYLYLLINYLSICIRLFFVRVCIYAYKNHKKQTNMWVNIYFFFFNLYNEKVHSIISFKTHFTRTNREFSVIYDHTHLFV